MALSAFVQLSKAWGLTTAEQSLLLNNPKDFTLLLEACPRRLTAGELKRIGQLLNIWGYLKIIYGGTTENVKTFFRRPFKITHTLHPSALDFLGQEGCVDAIARELLRRVYRP